MRYRQEHGDLLIVAGVGWSPGVVGHVTVGTDVRSPAGCALQSRQPVTVEDLPNNPEFRYPPVLRDHGIVAVLNVPVAVDGTVWGVLEVDSEVSRHFGQMDINFLLVMANILGSAIHSRQALEAATSVGAEAALALTQYKTLFSERDLPREHRTHVYRGPSSSGIAVGMRITAHPPHRSVRAAFPHTAPTSGV